MGAFSEGQELQYTRLNIGTVQQCKAVHHDGIIRRSEPCLDRNR